MDGEWTRLADTMAGELGGEAMWCSRKARMRARLNRELKGVLLQPTASIRVYVKQAALNMGAINDNADADRISWESHS